MHTHVNRHLVCHCKTFATHGALEWPFSCVSEPVGAHCAHLGESLTTIWANVWLLAGVNPGVAPQSSCCGETLGTVSALVRSLSCVSTHVLLQVVAVSEAAATDETALWSVIAVTQLVVGQAFFGQEALTTFLTLIGFLVVNSLMVLKLADAWESLIAVSAPEAMVGAVGKLVFTQLMVPQQVGHLEGLSTMRTLVFCQQLDTLMSDPLVQRPELTPTLGANVGSIFTLSLPVPGEVSFCAEGFTTLRAFVRLHCSVEPLVFEEFKTILKAPSTQWTIMRDSSSWVDSFDRCFPGGHRCRGSPISGATLPMFTATH